VARRTRWRARQLGVDLLLIAVVAALVGGWLWLDFERVRGTDAVELARPWALVLAASGLLVGWVGLGLRRRRAPTLRYSRVPDLLLAPRGPVARLASLPIALRVVIMVLLALALARPRTYRVEDVEVEGIDIMVVLDLSRSMEERDLQRNRLDAGQRTIREFLRKRKNDRIGLVVFAEQALLVSPLTLDYRSLDQIISDLVIGDVPEMGTAIGDGLGLALASLRRSDAASKVVILLSDGDSNAASELDPSEARDIAREMGVRVFTILLGLEEGRAPALRAGYAVNPALLRQLAADTGGLYFNAGDDRELDASFRAVRKTLETSRYRVTGRIYGELYQRVLWVALVLLLLELLLGLTRFRRFP